VLSQAVQRHRLVVNNAGGILPGTSLGVFQNDTAGAGASRLVASRNANWTDLPARLSELRPDAPLRHRAGHLGIQLQSPGDVRIAIGEVAFSALGQSTPVQ
jgi:hypothetical protein